MQEEEEDETAPHSPVSSAPPAAQGVAMSASSLSENPVFKRARGEKVLVGAKATPGADEGPSSRPISQAELEQRFYMQADGADSVVDDDLGDLKTKKKTPFRRHGNIYVLDAWVENPNWRPETSAKTKKPTADAEMLGFTRQGGR